MGKTGWKKKIWDVTALPEVLCSQVHDVHPLLCWDIQLFTSSTTLMEKNISRGEKGNWYKDMEVQATSVTSKNHQDSQGERGRQINGQKLGEGEADRHRVTIVMSKWSDTREKGRQTERSREMGKLGCRERNLCETCHNKVMAEQRGR